MFEVAVDVLVVVFCDGVGSDGVGTARGGGVGLGGNEAGSCVDCLGDGVDVCVCACC